MKGNFQNESMVQKLICHFLLNYIFKIIFSNEIFFNTGIEKEVGINTDEKLGILTPLLSTPVAMHLHCFFLSKCGNDVLDNYI